jgi:hypothetical protein
MRPLWERLTRLIRELLAVSKSGQRPSPLSRFRQTHRRVTSASANNLSPACPTWKADEHEIDPRDLRRPETKTLLRSAFPLVSVISHRPCPSQQGPALSFSIRGQCSVGGLIQLRRRWWRPSSAWRRRFHRASDVHFFWSHCWKFGRFALFLSERSVIIGICTK